MKDELEIIETTKNNGILIRSRAEHVENNEKNSKYFSNLEKIMLKAKQFKYKK